MKLREKVMLIILGCSFAWGVFASEESRWQNKRVLILGDSLVGDGSGLEIGLRKHFKEVGAEARTYWGVGARAASYAKSGDLTDTIQNIFKPDLIIVVLGINSCRTPLKQFEREVRKFNSSQLGKKDCIWIGPPPLLDEAGYLIMKMPGIIKKNTRCEYFDTAEKINFGKSSVSGFHVKRWKGRAWANKVWKWLEG
jgi:hypothetical protein